MLLAACAPNSGLKRFLLGPDVTLYPARKVITMNPEQPSATAVAIEDDRIVGVGSVESIVATLGDLQSSPLPSPETDARLTGVTAFADALSAGAVPFLGIFFRPLRTS